MIFALGALIALLLSGGWLCWSARPNIDEDTHQEWRGEQAADMASGVIIILAALNALWQNVTGNDTATLLLNSVAWYAALPLLVTVRVVQAAQNLGFAWHWNRMIWGRVFLGLCVVFELCRRANQLHIIIEVSALLGALSLLIIACRPNFTPYLLLFAGCWILGAIGYFISQPSDISWLTLPLVILIAVKFSAPRRSNIINHSNTP